MDSQEDFGKLLIRDYGSLKDSCIKVGDDNKVTWSINPLFSLIPILWDTKKYHVSLDLNHILVRSRKDNQLLDTALVSVFSMMYCERVKYGENIENFPIWIRANPKYLKEDSHA
jgi:hypothetical protein